MDMLNTRIGEYQALQYVTDLSPCPSQMHLHHFIQRNGKQYRVWQNELHRWLEINDTVQSIMDLRNPAVLLHPHCQWIARLLQSLPISSVLECGLGGGALNRYFRHQHPEITWLSLEVDDVVCELAQQHFAITPNRFLNIDCQQWHSTERFPCLLHDTAIELGLTTAQCSVHYWQPLLAHLTQSGFIVINALPNSSAELQQCLFALKEAARQTQLHLNCTQHPIPGYRNIVLLLSIQPT